MPRQTSFSCGLLLSHSSPPYSFILEICLTRWTHHILNPKRGTSLRFCDSAIDGTVLGSDKRAAPYQWINVQLTADCWFVLTEQCKSISTNKICHFVSYISHMFSFNKLPSDSSKFFKISF